MQVVSCYVICPTISVSLHWYLAIVFHPAGICHPEHWLKGYHGVTYDIDTKTLKSETSGYLIGEDHSNSPATLFTIRPENLHPYVVFDFFGASLPNLVQYIYSDI